jgi:hypothetical protein
MFHSLAEACSNMMLIFFIKSYWALQYTKLNWLNTLTY